MQFSVCAFGFTMFGVLLSVRTSEARAASNPPGLLDNMPHNCSDFDYCLVKHDRYPHDLIDDVLRNKYHLTLGSHQDELTYRSSSGQDSDSCKKIETYGQIYEIKDKDENVRVVVQSDALFKQIIRIEQCVSSTPTGIVLSSTELNNNDLFCDEKMLDYNFLVLTPDGNGVEFVKSKSGIPVCCSCKIRE